MRTKIAAILLAGLATVSVANAASAATLGELLANGQMTEPAFEQLIAGTGLNADTARGLTLDEVVAVRWQND